MDQDERCVVHLWGLTQEEFETCERARGATRCGHRPDPVGPRCGAEPALRVVVKRPGAPWGQGVHVASACSAHAAELAPCIDEIAALPEPEAAPFLAALHLIGVTKEEATAMGPPPDCIHPSGCGAPWTLAAMYKAPDGRILGASACDEHAPELQAMIDQLTDSEPQ